MGENSNISWCHHTFNIAWGCQKVSPACTNCYAEAFANRLGLKVWGPDTERRTFGDAHWREPLKWNRKAVKAGERYRVFSSSMCDVFEDHPTIEQERAKLWSLITATPMLDWLLLTKRADRIATCLPPDWGQGYSNVWLGVTAENQEWADKRIPHLIEIPAAVHFISAEPLLGELDLSNYLYTRYIMGGARHAYNQLEWIICGGESGVHYRQMNPFHARSLRDQCKAAGVAFFYKQGSGLRPAMSDLLDGCQYNEFPKGVAL